MAKANAAGGVTLRSNSVSEFSQENTNNSPVNKQAKRELKLPVSKIFFKTQNEFLKVKTPTQQGVSTSTKK